MIDDCKKRIPLSPKVMTTKELFEGRCYVIPEYQRDYVWDKEKNIKPFVQAIAEGVAKSEDIFLGTTLFRETEDGKFEVMDGRQRLTTLAVLLELCGESQRSELFGDEAKKEKVKEIEEVFIKVMQEVAIASDAHGEADDSDERFKEAFAKQLLENVYFVVVDSKLEIAKTFEIFKSINMTGKSLADEDIVKVIYAEHIAPECKGENNDEKLTDAAERVNKLYKSIKEQNLLAPNDVLQVLQAVLVASKGGTFDDFTQNKVDFFLEACKTNDSALKNLLSYESVELLFEVCHYVAKRTYGNVSFEVEERKQQYFKGLFEWTRYNRFWLLPYMDVFFRLHKNGGAFDKGAAAEALKAEALKAASKNAFEMFRLFAVYSVIYKKQVSEINTFVCNEIFPLLKDGCPSEAIAKKIDDKLNEGKCVSWFNGYLCEGWGDGLYSNYKRAALVCVMSELDAMLEEEKKDKDIREALFSWGNKTSLEDAKGKKYNGKYNCDHILARDLFKGAYKTEFCNGIGNLTLLSEKDNKSAQKKEPKTKAEDYYKRQEIFVEPRKIAEIIAEKGWGAAQIADRQNDRANRIWEFLRLDETGVKPDGIKARDVDPKNVDGRTE